MGIPTVSIRPAAGAALSALIVAGCAGPAARIDEQAATYGYQRAIVRGTEFDHVVYRNRAGGEGEAVHVYLEGDGVPWVTRRRISRDPTPRDPLMLRLMRADPAPSIYLGRPCYNGLQERPPCSPRLWTYERYSERVVASMVAAVERLRDGRAEPPIVLLGYSGGGALAMLMAASLPAVRAVVTLAGNLDLAAWTERHGYTPLAGSLEPARLPPLDANIAQLHLVGENDTNVTPAMLRAALRSQPGARLRVLAGFDHRCCWERIWPSVLDDLRRLESSR